MKSKSIEQLSKACQGDTGCCNDFAVAALVLAISKKSGKTYACARPYNKVEWWVRDKETDAWKSTDPNPLWLMIPQQAFDVLEGPRLDMFAIECKEAGDDMDGALKQNKVRAKCVGGPKSLSKCNRVFKAIERLSLQSTPPS
jgi:hypothetical protein